MDNSGGIGAFSFSLGVLPILCVCAVAIFEIVATWKVFAKAGQPGWAAIVPIYNVYVIIKIAGRPGWWLLLYLVPLVNVIIVILVMLDFAKAFGKGTGFALGLIFLGGIFFPMLAFSDARYRGAPA